MNNIFISILIVCSVFFFTGGPPLKDSPHHTVETTMPSQLNNVVQEDQITLKGRVDRMLHFKEAVEEAVGAKIKKEDFVPHDKIARSMKDALVVTEDKRFYEHSGLDFFGIIRAFYTNAVAGETLEGGSTITQQTVKNLFLSSQRTWSRKAEEALWALLLEHYYSKDEILAIYLNSIYYGNDFYGIKQASQGYFGLKPENLSVAQSAMLAGLPQAPSFYNPLQNYETAKKRQYTVLTLMASQGVLTLRDAEKAYKDDLGLLTYGSKP